MLNELIVDELIVDELSWLVRALLGRCGIAKRTVQL